MKNKYDAIIIGTGAGGGSIGYSLSKKGLRVLFIEKGLDYKQSLKSNYAEHYKDKNKLWSETLKKSGRDFDYIFEKNKEKYPFLGSGSGGSTALYGMAMERFLKSDFEAREKTKLNEKSNLPEDGWPINYNDLLPYYIKAEKLYNVSGSIDPLKKNDKFDYKKAPDINKSNKELFTFLKAKT